MKFFNSKQKVSGEIGYYNLTDWWLSEFTEQERQYLERIYTPMGMESLESPLTKGDISSSSQSVGGFLNALASWPKKEYEYLVEKIFRKSEELATSTLDKHFCYLTQIIFYYRQRSNPDMLQKAIDACWKQINLSPEAIDAFKREEVRDQFYAPMHTGYLQLSIIFYKQGKYTEAIELCHKAQDQGWNGDWDKRIERYTKKLNTKA